jgi:hypothetical protein
MKKPPRKDVINFISSRRSLFLWLALPLLLLSVIFLISSNSNPQSILLNIGTDFISIIFTVFYVDWVLKSNENDRWKNARFLITSEVGSFAQGTITSVLEMLDLEKEIIPDGIPTSPRQLQLHILDQVKNLEISRLELKLDQFDETRWLGFIATIREKQQRSISIFNQFENRMEPEEMEIYLKFRGLFSNIISTYELFHDFLGVPLDNLPNVKGGNSWAYSMISLKNIAFDLQKLLLLAIEVIEEFKYITTDSFDNEFYKTLNS